MIREDLPLSLVFELTSKSSKHGKQTKKGRKLVKLFEASCDHIYMYNHGRKKGKIMSDRI